jgi:hypothetical protein
MSNGPCWCSTAACATPTCTGPRRARPPRPPGPAAAHSLLLVPQFLAERDVAAHGLPADTLRWSLEGWMGGEAATAPAALSSFEAIDALLALLADRQRFPKLSQVVVAGHSGGAQVVQRYAVVGQGEGRLPGVAVRYVVANPSSYLYFHPSGRCRPWPRLPGVNHWKYGWADAPGYAPAQPRRLRGPLPAARCALPAGQRRPNPQHPALDKSCAAEPRAPTATPAATTVGRPAPAPPRAGPAPARRARRGPRRRRHAGLGLRPGRAV